MDDNHLLHLGGQPRLVLVEWVPTGAHFVHALERRFGCRSSTRAAERGTTAVLRKMTREQSNFYVTSEVDEEPNAALVPEKAVEITFRVADHRDMEFIRLEGIIDIAQTGGDTQKEHVGVEITREGLLNYGIRLEKSCSLDEMACIIADLTQDTSQVMDTILSAYQKRLLEVVFCGESRQRDKFTVLIAESVNGKDGSAVSLDKILANPAYRAEMRQVLGKLDVEGSVTLSDGGFMLPGEHGLLFVSSHPEECYELVNAYGVMAAMVLLVNNVFARLAAAWDSLAEQQSRIQTRGIEAIMDIQTTLTELSADQGVLASIPEQIARDIQTIDRWVHERKLLEQAESMNLGIVRDMVVQFADLPNRVERVSQFLEALGREIENVRTLVATLGDKEAHNINKAMNILTVVSVIVLPLSLITGIYGMNFWAYPPEGDPAFPWNMPELYWQYGYPVTLGIMATIAGGLAALFWKLGLLGNLKFTWRTRKAARHRLPDNRPYAAPVPHEGKREEPNPPPPAL